MTSLGRHHIQVLPEPVAARIAAGEVVERPASVVKELVENSLDAGASRIQVDVEDGGRSSIRVVDNGAGIPAAELKLAFQRFATSKLDASSDLIGIPTLGFRGEALPSIASVAVVSAISRTESEAAAATLDLEFGQVRASGKQGAPVGTSITVRRLFENVPARLKFLGSAGAELSRVHQVVAHYALTRPDVAFTLSSNGATRLNTAGASDLQDAVAAVYDWQVAKAMLPLSSPDTDEAFKPKGMIAAPSVTRGNRNYVTLSINGRWIQNRRLAFAVEQAFEGFLSERRFPIAVIDLRVPLGDVDVNVHPAKSEVRLLRERLVYAELQRTVRAAILEWSPVPQMSHHRLPEALPKTGTAPSAWRRAGLNPLWPDPLTGTPSESQQPSFSNHSHGASVPNAPETTGIPDDGGENSLGTATDRVAPEGQTNHTHHRTLPLLRVIGQAQEMYIIAEGPDGVYLVDQHAAHERVMFEQIRDRIGRGTVQIQQLLTPETVELLPHQEEAFGEHQDWLAKAGYLVEPFGPSTVAVRAIPATMVRQAVGQTLATLLDILADGSSVDGWQQELIAAMACRSAVTAGMAITLEEGRDLIRQLETTAQPHTCPHGRPTMIHLSAMALQREFGRR